MAESGWDIAGQYMESCNCDYLCPCIYTNPQGEATHEHCFALMAYRIDAGQMDGINLDGLKFAFVIRSGKVMADGDWAFAAVVDEAANSQQRAALTSIVSGDSGGIPGKIRANLVSDFRGVVVKPIEFTMDGLERSVSIPEVLGFEVEGVASRNGNGEPFYIDNTAHPANRRLALARSKSLWLKGFEFALEMLGKGNNGHFAPFSWTGG